MNYLLFPKTWLIALSRFQNRIMSLSVSNPDSREPEKDRKTGPVSNSGSSNWGFQKVIILFKQRRSFQALKEKKNQVQTCSGHELMCLQSIYAVWRELMRFSSLERAKKSSSNLFRTSIDMFIKHLCSMTWIDAIFKPWKSKTIKLKLVQDVHWCVYKAFEQYDVNWCNFQALQDMIWFVYKAFMLYDVNWCDLQALKKAMNHV